MTPATEWYREQSEYNRRFYEWLQAVRPNDVHDWKMAVLFDSGLHRANYRFARETRAPVYAERDVRQAAQGKLPVRQRDGASPREPLREEPAGPARAAAGAQGLRRSLCDKHAGAVPRGAQAHTRYKPAVEAADRITDALPL